MTATVWVPTPPSGLMAPAAVPALTLDQAITRRWEMRGALLVPRQPEYLPVGLVVHPGPIFETIHKWG